MNIYLTAEWKRVRAKFLARHKRCAMCRRPATVVDHIKPHKGNMKLFWDKTNYQPLCKPCHDSVKKLMEINAHKATIGEDGYPVSSDSPWCNTYQLSASTDVYVGDVCSTT